MKLLIIPLLLLLSAQDRAAKEARAQGDLGSFEVGLGNYKKDNGKFPSTAEGLNALVSKPAGAGNWKGPYLDMKEIPRDPWGRAYVYRSPGQKNPEFDLFSPGPDGRPDSIDDVWKK